MRRLSFLLTLTASLAIVATPADARITNPTDGATVRGVVTIDEDRGAVRDSFCAAFGATASSTITVTRLRDNTVVHQQTRTSPGAWSTVWDARGEIEDGAFRIVSTAQDRTLSSFCFNGARTLSTIVVQLANYTTFVDDDGAGTISINPYVQRFRIRTSGGYDSGTRHDPAMRFVAIPAVRAAPACDPTTDPTGCAPEPPGLAAWCTDPTAPAFVPRLLEEGPQGCLPGSVPAPPAPPAPPGPPNPPPIDPNDPPEPPAPPGTPDPSALCSTPATTGCPDRAIVLAYTADDLVLAGAFHELDGVFAAAALDRAGGTPIALRRLPSA